LVAHYISLYTSAMKASNIFAYAELSKFSEGLDCDDCRSALLKLHAYFHVIPSTMFSEQLAQEWEAICATVARYGPLFDDDGRVIVNSVKNTISQMQKSECFDLVRQIRQLRDKVAAEF